VTALLLLLLLLLLRAAGWHTPVLARPQQVWGVTRSVVTG
jgi:hypothetical protein